jgi:hypothetical protein
MVRQRVRPAVVEPSNAPDRTKTAREQEDQHSCHNHTTEEGVKQIHKCVRTEFPLIHQTDE